MSDVLATGSSIAALKRLAAHNVDAKTGIVNMFFIEATPVLYILLFDLLLFPFKVYDLYKIRKFLSYME
jgi:hypothetical protein